MNSTTLSWSMFSNLWYVPGGCDISSAKFGTMWRGLFCRFRYLLCSWWNIQKSSSLLSAAMACFLLLADHCRSSSGVGHSSQLLCRSTGVYSYSLITEFNICITLILIFKINVRRWSMTHTHTLTYFTHKHIPGPLEKNLYFKAQTKGISNSSFFAELSMIWSSDVASYE